MGYLDLKGPRIVMHLCTETLGIQATPPWGWEQQTLGHKQNSTYGGFLKWRSFKSSLLMGFPTINKIQLLAYPHLRNPPYSCKLVNGSLITELIYPILVKSNAISLNTSPGGSKPKAHPRCYGEWL